MLEVPFPDTYGSRILFPRIAEFFKFGSGCCKIHCSIDFFEICRECLVIFGWDIADGVADQVHDAVLHHDFGKNRFGSLFQPGYAVHTDKKDIFDAARLDFIKNLHPLVLAFRGTEP